MPFNRRHPKTRRSRIRRGSMLLDVLFGVFFLAAAVLTTAAVDLTGSQAISRSQAIEVATQAARARLEEARGNGFANLPAVPSGNTATSVEFPAPPELPGAAGVLTVTRVDEQDQPTTTETKRRRLTATVTWAGRLSNHGTVTLVTLLTN